MMTAKEAWEEGIPGTYMGGEFFPAPLCIHCMGYPEDRGKHQGCVWKYWGDQPWIPSPEELEL